MPSLGEIAALTSAVTWAAANVAFARLPTSSSAFAIATLKSALATLLCALTLLVLEGTLWPALDGRSTALLALSAIIGITIGDVAYFAALIRLGAKRAIFLGTLVPPLSALVAYFAFDEALTWLQIIGMVLTLGGVTFVLYQGTADREDRSKTPLGPGLFFGLVAVAFQVAANILTKEGAGTHSALAVSTVRLVIGSTGLLVWAALARKIGEVVLPLRTRRSAGLMALATVLGSYFGVWFYMAAIMYTEVGIAVTLSSTSPIFITIFAHFFLGERATLRPFVGAAISVLGVALLFLGG